MGGGSGRVKVDKSAMREFVAKNKENVKPNVLSSIAERFLTIVNEIEDSKTALKESRIPIESISQVPELQIHPLLGRIIDIARDDIGEGMINFTFFYGLMKVFTDETDIGTK